MANRIKGITIELNGDATGLQDALKGVNGSLCNTQKALSDVTKLLKLDPKNTALVEQKQKLLADAVEQTREKLDALESAQEQVQQAFDKGELGDDKYLAFRRELEATRGQLGKYETDLSSLETEQERLGSNTQRLEKLFAATGQSVDDYADVLGSRLTSAIKGGYASADQLQSAFGKVARAATGGKGDIRALADAVDTVDDGDAIRNLIQSLKETGDAAGDAADGVEQIAQLTKGQALMQAADSLSGVGEKVQEIGSNAVDAYNQTQGAMTKVNAYFGASGKAAEQSAAVIRDVYGAGVGDSMDSVANAVILVKKNLEGLSKADITHIVEQAMTLDELYGIDMNETLRGVNSLMKQYGLTAQEAMDYIVKGTQNGLDKTDELGDNLSEYAGKFKQAGYSVSEYFQLLDNGLGGGAYQLDKVNDAINEVTNRLADGTIAKEIGQFSTGTQQVFQDWKNGGATQKQVIDSIVSDISNTTNQQKALNKAALAFGTMAEDGSLKFITSLTSVGDTYQKVGGAAQGMFDQTTTPAQQMESNLRKVQAALEPLGETLMELANTVLTPVADGLAKVAEWFGSLPQPMQDFAVVLGALAAAFVVLAPLVAGIVTAVGLFKAALLPVLGPVAAIAAGIALVVAVVKNWGAIMEWGKGIIGAAVDAVGEKITQLKEWFAGVWAAIQDAAGGVADAVGGAISAVITTVEDVFTTVRDTVVGAWDAVIDAVSTAWETIKNVVQVGVLFIGSILDAAFQIITLPWRFLWANCGETILAIWEGIKTTVANAIQAVADIISTVTGAIRDFIVPIWTAITTAVTGAMDTIGGVVSSVWDAIYSKVSAVVTTIASVVSTVFNGIKGVASTVWTAIKTVVGGAVDGIKTKVTNIFNAVKGFVTNVWNGIKATITGAAEGAKTKVTGVFEGVKSKVTTVFNGIKTTATTVWNAIKNAITTPIEKAKEKVKNVVDAIKGFFAGLKLKLPDIKLPHFKIKGSFSLNPPSVPHLSIDWYKEGGIFNNPSIIGVGEAGPEAVLPIEKLNLMLTSMADSIVSGVSTLLRASSVGTGGDVHLDVYLYPSGPKMGEQIVSTYDTYKRRLGG